MSERLWSGLGLFAPLQARLSGAIPSGITGVSIDSRSVQPGDLFFAIKGDNSNGHDYVADALAKGAAAAVVDEAHADALKHSGPLYIVRDVLHALEGLGIAARARSTAHIVAVTGSVGKTSTKEALRTVFSAAGPTHASLASLNNHWGVPLTLARLPADARYAVFELGMNHAGELTPLTLMVRPQVAIITAIAAVHLEYFASVDAIADAKAEIFSGIEPGGTAILPRDVAQYERLYDRARASAAASILTFGENQTADARLESIEPRGGGSLVSADILGTKLTYQLGAAGRHMAMNSLAVLLAAHAAGRDVGEAAKALADFEAPAGRGQRLSFKTRSGDFIVIDESYNANPASMRAALAMLGETPLTPLGRRVAVLGDMLELGPQAADLHTGLEDDIERQEIDLVYAAGPLMKNLFEALPEGRRGRWAPEASGLIETLLDSVQAGDVLMVKGSNGSRMGSIVEALKDRFAARSASLVH